jgi:peptide/nickel transport system permease protein
MTKYLPALLLFCWLLAVVIGRVFDLHGNNIDLNSILATPSLQHWFGADDLGRDILARILRGVEVSFIVAVSVTLVTMIIGILVGLYAGFYGGKVDQLLMQITDIFLAFPGVLLAIAFAAVLGWYYKFGHCFMRCWLGELCKACARANFKLT